MVGDWLVTPVIIILTVQPISFLEENSERLTFCCNLVPVNYGKYCIVFFYIFSYINPGLTIKS